MLHKEFLIESRRCRRTPLILHYYIHYASIKECIIYNVPPITIICICKHDIRHTMNNYLTSWRSSEIREVVTV